MNSYKWIISCLLVFLLSNELAAQYFGRNKPRYRDFKFEVYQTPHFDIYHYFRSRDKINELSQWSEQWYDMHQSVLRDTFTEQNPILFYHDHADFQQTNAISGAISVGTGGVTEAFKNRVVMPLTLTNQQTNHVLGHEMVHAFQYHMVIHGDSTNLTNLANLPLWMVEGMAEYMSIGRHDANTAMWMRDVVLNDKVPTLKDLSNPKYFPYRYGQAFWAFVTGLYGDEVIKPLFINTAKFGLQFAIDSTLKTNFATLSSQFKSALENYYTPLIGDKKENFIGKKLLSEENSGRINISPVVSPNGRYIIFLSEKDLISTDLYLADTRDGKILRKVVSTVKDGHLDHLDWLESSGTWSPDSKKFAFVAFKKGRNVLVIKDVATGKTLDEMTFKNLPAFANPAWSPKGRKIVVSGLVDGQTDLFQIDTRTKKATQLTDDRYSEIQANWNADGTQLVFATDKLSFLRGRTKGKFAMNIGTLNVENGSGADFDFFAGADNLNPEFDQEGNIYFLSDRDGFRNLYKYEVANSKLLQMTDFKVGISGITSYSPAISVSKRRDEVFFSNYFDGQYSIYKAKSDDFLHLEVDPEEMDYAALTLPVVGVQKVDLVNSNLDYLDQRPVPDVSEFKRIPYKPQFKLDYIGGSTGGGVGVSNSYGTQTGLQGGIDMLFSDILGNNQLYTGLALNGEIYDVAAQFQYINRKHRLAWGAVLSHIPYRTGYSDFGFIRDTLQDSFGNQFPAWRDDLNLIRIFEDGISGFVQYPFSTTQRLELSVSSKYQYFRWDVYQYYYNDFGQFIWQDREKQKIEGDLNLGGLLIRKGFTQNASLAYVGDNSYFGLTSPLAGYRFRIGVDKSFGENDFYTTLVDLRKYQRFNPVTIAIRGMHYARYGRDANIFYPIYLGQNGLAGMIHGYKYNELEILQEKYGITFNQLAGSKIFITNFEVRLPFTGPEKLALIKSKFLPTELNFFLDGGMAWNDYDQFDLEDNDPAKPLFLMSTGLGLRVNLMGALILEPYYAIPLRKGGVGSFGINLSPGW